MSTWTEALIPDQSGRVLLITGANSGIGLQAARALAEHGAHVVLACRSRPKAEAARDQILAAALPLIGNEPVTVKRGFGWLFSPFMWTLGVPWAEAGTAGSLMGTKAILNEYVAYLEFAGLPAEALSARSKLIVTYALCNVANLASVGLLVSTISTLAPDRRRDAVSLGMKSWVAGNLASAMGAAMIGLVTPVAISAA